MKNLTNTLLPQRCRLINYTGMVVLTATAFLLHYFFLFNEKRRGFQLHDWVLDHISARDCSVPIFLLIWGMLALLVKRVLKDKTLLMHFCWTYIFVCLSRMATIYFIELDPPRGIIDLVDPITGIVYGKHVVINRDLFYSGHTSLLFLMFLCFPRRSDKRLALAATCIVGPLLLAQHVHYTIDVIAAPAMVYLLFIMTSRLLKTLSAGIKAEPERVAGTSPVLTEMLSQHTGSWPDG